ncbi:hypothetical protein pb186bvf_018290 [Paramecium bursaria]
MYFLFFGVLVMGQLESLRSSQLGNTILETIQLHLETDEPISNLITLLDGIQVKHQLNLEANYTKDYQKCQKEKETVIELVNDLHSQKMELREEIQLHKPKIEQLLIMNEIKEKERDILVEQAKTIKNRMDVQKQVYDRNLNILDDQRYDYASYKIPIEGLNSSILKKEEIKPFLRPVQRYLIDYIDERIVFEDKALSAKKRYYELQSHQINEQYHSLTDQQDEINEKLQDLKLIVQSLENDWVELNRKLDTKQIELNDIKNHCQEIQGQYQNRKKQIHLQFETVLKAKDLIEHNYGWLRQQLGF